MITGRHADGRRFEQKVTSRNKKIRIDQKDLVELELGELPAVEELYIRAERLVALSLEPLANTKLSTLKLIGELPALDLSPLSGLPLTELVISGGPPELDLAPLATCTELTDLSIYDGSLAAIDLAPLANCSKLRLMWLRSLQLTELDLRPLADLPGFNAAVCDGSKLTTVTLGDHGFRAITHLAIEKNPLETVDVGVLATSRTLKSLRVPHDFPLPFQRKEIVYV
ncbi:MAG TPA: hypothetical protein VGC41_07480 [Kofleriaceae bacterium]